MRKFLSHSNLILMGKSASDKCWSHENDGSIFVQEDTIFCKLINYFGKNITLFGNILELEKNHFMPFLSLYYRKCKSERHLKIFWIYQTEHNYNFRNAINENGFWQTIKTSKTKAVSYLDVQQTSWIIFSVQSYKLEL